MILLLQTTTSLLIVSLMLNGCAGLKIREDFRKKEPPVVQKSSEETKSLEGKRPESLPTGAASTATELPKVAVVLGPGGVKAFAHAGVLKELVKARIPIGAVVGIEWGALVGAFYAQNGKTHEVEWKLYKLQKADLPGKGLFSASFKAESIGVLKKYFIQNLGEMSIDWAKLEFACPSQSIWSGALVWQSRGRLDRALSKCMPYPPLFRPSSPWMAAAFAEEDSMRYLKRRGYQVIIYVNVLGTGELFSQDELLENYQSALLWQEIRRSKKRIQKLATDVIEVDTREYKMFDFSNHTGLVSVGELAGRRQARKLIEKYGF